jgi:hypothetical protein
MIKMDIKVIGKAFRGVPMNDGTTMQVLRGFYEQMDEEGKERLRKNIVSG